MPPELREEFLSLMNDLTKKDGNALKEKTAIYATVEAMTEGEAQMMVDRILALCDLIKLFPAARKSLINFFANELYFQRIQVSFEASISIPKTAF